MEICLKGIVERTSHNLNELPVRVLIESGYFAEVQVVFRELDDYGLC